MKMNLVHALLVLTGDNVSGTFNKSLGERLIAFLDTLEVPYALVMGNHDGEGFWNNEKMGGIFGSGKYSLFSPGPDNIHGTGNYGVNIVDDRNRVLYGLVMLDSNRYRGGGYDYIYPDQIAWYEWYVQGISADTPVKTMAFFHIPLPEINDIRTEMQNSDAALASDVFREDPCPPTENTGLFSKMKELKSTTHMFFGHDHVNLLNYNYQGIQFVYGLKTGTCSYYNLDRLGTTLITLKDDLSVTVEFKFAQVE
jgi:hypothetical protein